MLVFFVTYCLMICENEEKSQRDKNVVSYKTKKTSENPFSEVT